MIDEMNYNDLLRVLLSEKGNGAKVMIEELTIKEPIEFQHNDLTLKVLFKDLQTDFYGRYDFFEMQQVVLEDRRIRLNAWVAKILEISVEKIKINKFVDPAASKKDKKSVRNLNFTLDRKVPLSLTTKKKNIAEMPVDFPLSIVDKSKYEKNEEAMVLNKLLHRHSHKFTAIDNINGKDNNSTTVFLMKNINEGRNGNWNNYATLKGNSVESYVKFKSRFDRK